MGWDIKVDKAAICSYSIATSSTGFSFKLVSHQWEDYTVRGQDYATGAFTFINAALPMVIGHCLRYRYSQLLAVDLFD